MMKKARVWLFGNDINTDLIIPGKYLDNYDPAHLAAHAMEGASKDFSSLVSKGDIIVAGRNFGAGSSREQAVTALAHAGVRAVVAQSFARIFYRNAINLGLPAVVSQDAANIFHVGDLVFFDENGAKVISVDMLRTAKLEPIPEHLRKILEMGGLIPYIKNKLKTK